MKVSIVIPNYNGIKLLKSNLAYVVSALTFMKQKTGNDGELVVVDDGSVDKSVEFLEQFARSVKEVPVLLVVNQKNRGFSPTVNTGVKKASGEIVILLNSDVIPEKDFILPLLPHFVDKKVFAVACMEKSIENGKTVLRGRGVGRWVDGYLKHSLGSLDKNNTLWAAGGSSAFRKSLWERVGGLCELYAPYYWEDIDLSYRALKSGYTVLFESKSVVIHNHEEGAIKKSQSKRKVNNIVNRNQNIFVLLNATDTNLIFSYFFHLPLHIARAIKNGDTAYIGGLFMTLALLPKIFSYRQRYKKLFVRSDKAVVAPFAE